MHHSRAGNFHPAAILANVAAFPFTNQTRNINLRAWLGERKERRPVPDLDVFAIHLLRKMIKRLLQIGKTYILINIQSLYLMKEAMCSCRNGFVTIYAPRHNRSDGRLLLLHQSDLNIRSVSAQQDVGIFFNEERILHLTRRVIWRKIQCSEIVPIIFYLGPISYIESQLFKNFNDAITCKT